ncbi:MAG: TrpB-like pyridoxal-phosphate dependent enzyme [Lentisphaerae bacterium RIFOXYC12_FULL_60_16]|nr:MAG: TrpB-like pyridoxal-phosphate dependent enzyme [Lentisphaerae bacterium RIFOXYC12_FULL_60_16]OGV68492.1 MAG: TrpB-like pyridoxal-phosphate dependent enzyme [Lentisphaerae bacterium RIFOXYA12_FULL_60_10]
MDEDVKVCLTEREIPRKWYNIQADLPHPLPPPLGKDGKPIGPEALAPVFPMNLIEQEVSTKRWHAIPEPILEVYRLWRPSPLRRARRLEKALKTPAKIYYKDESVSPPGSHKANTAVAQAYYNREFGIKRLATETGAGQWGCALSLGCKLMGLECKVYMVRISFDQKPFRKMMMRMWGGQCVASPSMETQAGRTILQQQPNTPGSLAIAISEAIEDAVTSKDTRYALGSVLNHVLMHQTVIGLETQKQMKKIGLYPDVVIGCAGGGSNFAGMAFPFVADRIHGKSVRILAVEPAACPTLTRGPFAYDSGDVAMMTPLLAMHTLGHAFVPAPIHAGGLRYHGMAPLVSHVLREGLIEAAALPQTECYEAAMLFANTEGFIPAPETSHAIAAAIREAKRATEEGKERIILFNYSGHGLMDLNGYEAYLNGKLTDYELPDQELQTSLKCLEGLPKPPPLQG